jgi:uncharacterized cupin superfamily protein
MDFPDNHVWWSEGNCKVTISGEVGQLGPGDFIVFRIDSSEYQVHPHMAHQFMNRSITKSGLRLRGI